MYGKKAFTLVELIVGITISMLLMTSVGMLVSSGMQNILKQKNIMDKNSLLSESVSDFYSGFENISNSGGYIFHSQSGAIFKVDSSISKGGFGYFGITTLPNLYCSDDSEFQNLDYLTWKYFIPYEEIGEDIFTDFSNIETQTVSSGATTYTVDTLNHQVLRNNTRIIGGEIFGHEIDHGSFGTNTRLNNPTGIVLAEGGFFLSDTLNNRILFFKDDNVYLLLDQSDGIKQPTGLAYDNNTSILYIANSGNGEILTLSSEILTINPELNISITPHNNINSISRLSIQIPSITGNITGITSTDITLTNINHGSGYLDINGNAIDYYFTDYRNIAEPITNGYINNCTDSDTYTLNGTTPERHIYSCSDTHTGTYQIHTGNIYETLNQNNNYSINITNIEPWISQEGTHLVDVELYNNSTVRYTNTHSYFTQGDGNIHSTENIKLNQLVSGLSYPTGLNLTNGNRLEVNDFVSRKQLSYDLSNINNLSDIDLQDFSSSHIQTIPYQSGIDTILENPISQFNIDYDNTNNFISSQVQYYQYLNCYNPEELVEKTIIFQKNIN